MTRIKHTRNRLRDHRRAMRRFERSIRQLERVKTRLLGEHAWWMLECLGHSELGQVTRTGF